MTNPKQAPIETDPVDDLHGIAPRLTLILEKTEVALFVDDNRMFTIKLQGQERSLSGIAVTQKSRNALNQLIATQVLEARIDEINELVVASNSYGADLSYSSDDKGFYVVDKSDVEDRLQALLTKSKEIK